MNSFFFDNSVSGNNCEIVGSCVSRPCGDHGTCIQLNTTEYVCDCIHGFTGVHCEEQIDYCSSSPCLNGATCEKLVGSFKCFCIEGFTGQFSSIDRHFWLGKSVSIKFSICFFLSFTGDTCAVDIDDCMDNACLNGGRCTDRINGYECDCAGTGYKGQRCGEDVDECSEGLCKNGFCHNLLGSYNCECDFGSMLI